MCQSTSTPCGGQCSGDQVLCGADTCLTPAEVTMYTSCNGACQSVDIPCNGVCPLGSQPCGQFCLSHDMMGLFYECNGKTLNCWYKNKISNLILNTKECAKASMSPAMDLAQWTWISMMEVQITNILFKNWIDCITAGKSIDYVIISVMSPHWHMSPHDHSWSVWLLLWWGHYSVSILQCNNSNSNLSVH